MGLSNGDINLIQIIWNNEELKTNLITVLKNVHDFGVNSLDTLII